jgi:glycosyltransferase involved in cell wall biosynthesis
MKTGIKYIKNLHCFISPMLNESRVMKETNSLIKLGLVSEVKILGYWDLGLDINEKIDNYREIVRITTLLKKNKIKKSIFRKIVAIISFFELNIKYLIYLIRYKPNFISCHNLILLPVCVLGKLISGSKLIYLPHELETEKEGLKGPLKKINALIEKLFFKYADKIIVVCEPIAEWYRLVYNSNNIFVLRNVPFNPFIDKQFIRSHKLRNEFCISESEIIFIYQGIIDKARGCKEIIDLFANVNNDRHIIMMGFGDMEDYVKEMSSKFTNIHYKAAVPIDQIIEYTSSADIGIHFLPFDISLSYRLSMPNKFFEYLMGGLPVIVSDNLEYLSDEIRFNNIGWVIEGNQKKLENFINNINLKEIKSKQTNLYSAKHGWQFEQQILNNVYVL